VDKSQSWVRVRVGPDGLHFCDRFHFPSRAEEKLKTIKKHNEKKKGEAA
jgi:hypothetical protein